MAKAVWTEPALADLHSIIEYIAADSPVYAALFGTGLVQAPGHLDSFPRIGRIVPEFDNENIREIIHGSYRIIYEIRGEDCYIVAIVHGGRDLLRLLKPGDFQTE